MVERTCKKCDICKTTVAVKRSLRYRVIQPFVDMTCVSSEVWGDTTRTPMHICNECWMDLKDQIQVVMSKQKADNGN